MEHLIQYTINIDDEVVRKRILESGYDDIINKLVEEAKEGLPKQSKFGYFNDKSNDKLDWSFLVYKALDSFMEGHKDEIISEAAKMLADSYKRTKAFKEKAAEAIK